MSKEKSAAPQQPENNRDEDAVAFAQGIFDLARNDGATMLAPLLEAGVPVNMRTSEGDTLLMLATRNGHLTTVRLLLARGANPDQPDNQLRTPLMVAALSNQASLVDELLRAGADDSLTDTEGHTALGHARNANAKDSIRQLESVN